MLLLVFKREQKGKKDAAELKRKQKESEKKVREEGEVVNEEEDTETSATTTPLAENNKTVEGEETEQVNDEAMETEN